MQDQKWVQVFPAGIFLSIGLCAATLYFGVHTYANSLPPSVGPVNAREICATIGLYEPPCRDEEVPGLIRAMFPEGSTRDHVRDTLGPYMVSSYIPSSQKDTIIDEYVFERPSLLGPHIVSFSFTREGILKHISYYLD